MKTRRYAVLVADKPRLYVDLGKVHVGDEVLPIVRLVFSEAHHVDVVGDLDGVRMCVDFGTQLDQVLIQPPVHQSGELID